ncbi:MAG: hypothetical protein Fur006_66240 [Coleofasciculaceae cyanobacterium]
MLNALIAIAKKYALPGFFILLGTIPLVGALIVYRNTNLYLAEAAKSEGTVVKVVRPPNNDVYYPIVQFTSQNGQTIEFQSSVGSHPPSYSKGQKVEVLYQPTNPQDARISSKDSSDSILSVIFTGIGGIFILIGTGVFLPGLLKGRKDKYLKKHGMPIETEYQRVQTDTWLTVTGRHSSRVVTQWQNPSTGELHIFKSDHLWSDPSSYIENEKITKITVFIEEGNPKKYYVDLSFLPNPDLSPDD